MSKSRLFTTRRFIPAASLMLAASLALSACAKTDPAPAAGTGAAPAQGGTAASAKVKLNYWTPFSGGDGDFMNEMVKKFNEESKDTQVEILNSKSEDYYTKLQTAVASDQAPDVAVMHSARLPQFVPAGTLSPLDEHASSAGVNWGDFNKNILDSTVYDGRHYSIPLDTHALVMYYNTKFLDQAGVLKDGRPVFEKSPEGFTAFLQKIKDSVPKDVAPLAQPNVRIDAYWMFWGFYNQLKDGGKFYGEDGKKGALNNPAALQALEYVNSLYTKELIPPNINDAFKLFLEGKAAVLVTGVWGTGAFENAKGLEFGVVPMPQIYDQPATWGDSHTLVLPKHSKEDPAKQKAAVAFSNWLAQHGAMWAKAGHVPAVTKVTQSDEFKALKYRAEYVESANYVKYWPRNGKQGQINDEIIKEFEKMMFKKQDPAATLKNADAIIDKLNK
ncbi:ABC transporter substrate-binding protein [Paenibacillus mucilaginosus]|uniref:Extracellular solute-binding protein family 1 n=1 Tax=Paenibacillus mucilaginosus (strain KNP414) TaxID=1036673 RepID=F8F584_PAEMK|nr:ABC transporter substrate-binding protein [Paenibacillus mucilaginosus]AEI40814.1 extracellular solute-binding protein family 1 [Paenibacillus mucilaginosus KNP414]MCG7211715.1 ABC transporter substrate-binding protein [Paenibacillus mucilaginosus]WDM29929.1 ABC transporter substrate-binding protein [Paenibacillus mucilaginosus]